MCRSIVTLRGSDPVADAEVHAAALQFVRKISGYRQPSRTNAAAFDRAVDEVAGSVRRLLDDLVATGPRPAPRRRTDRGVSAGPAPAPATEAAAG